MLLQLSLQLVLPSMLLLSLWRACPKSRLEWLLPFLAILAAYFPVFLIARWDFTSYYLRYGFALFLFAGFRGYRKVTNLPAEKPSPLLSMTAILLTAPHCPCGCWPDHRCPAGSMRLSFPLRGGVYYVGGGGNNRFLNNHQLHEPQKFALDTVRLNTLGNRSTRLIPRELEHFAIYGDTVYAPSTT